MSKLSYDDKINIYQERKNGNTISNISKKYNVVKNRISTSLAENPNRKIVVFSTYADTAEYVKDCLEKNKFKIYHRFRSINHPWRWIWSL